MSKKSIRAKSAKTRRSPFIKEVRHAWKFYSVIANSINGSVITAWLAMPDEWKAGFPANYLGGFVLVMLALGSFGVILKQTFKP